MTDLNRLRQDSFTSNIEFNIKQLDKTVTIKIALELNDVAKSKCCLRDSCQR